MALIYEIEVRYRMAGAGLGRITDMERAARRATSSFNGLRAAIALVGGGLILGKAKKAFFDFNSEIETMKIGLATGFSANLKIPFVEAKVEADKLFKRFQQIALEAPGTTKDFLDVSQWISRSLLSNGGNLKELENITRATTIAAQVYRLDPAVAGRDIDQFLRGALTVRDQLAQQIATEMGVKGGHLAVNKMSPGERRKILNEWAAMRPGSSLSEGEKAMRNSPAGAASALYEQYQMLMGAAGKSLTEAITKTMIGATNWLKNNQSQVNVWVKELSSMLMGAWEMAKSAASAVRSVIQFIAENKGLLTGLGEVFLILAGANFAASIGSSITALGGMAAAMNPVILGLAAFAAGLTLAAGWIGDKIDQRNLHDTLINGAFNPSMDRFNSSATRLNQPFAGSTLEDINNQRNAAWMRHVNDAMDVLMLAKDAGALTPVQGARGIIGVNLDQQRLLAYLAKNNVTGDDADTITRGVGLAFDTALQEHGRLLQRLFGVDNAFSPGAMFAGGLSGLGSGFNSGAFAPTKTNVNVSINKIEVASDDPDRFVMGMVRSFEETVRNPTQAASALRGGLG